MTGCGVRVTSNLLHVDLDISNSLCSVNDGQNVSILRQRDDLPDRHLKTGRANDMTDTNDPGLPGYRAVEPFDDLADIMIPGGYHHAVYTDTPALLEVLPTGAASFVLNISRQNTVTVNEIDAERRDIH